MDTRNTFNPTRPKGAAVFDRQGQTMLAWQESIAGSTSTTGPGR